MNVERLNNIASELHFEFDEYDIVSNLTNINNHLENIINQPNQPQHQQNLSKERDDLFEKLMEAPSNRFSPAWKQVIAEIGGTGLLGVGLRNNINEILEKNQLTPSTALEKLNVILSDLENFKSSIDNLIIGLEGLGIGQEELEPGDCEIGYFIPRDFIKNNLNSYVKEVGEFYFILSTLSEVVLGKKAELEVKTVSSSDFMIFIAAGLILTDTLAKFTERILSNYKKILEIKKLRNDLKAQGIPESKTKGIEEHANSLMEKEIKKLVNEIIKEHYKERDKGRKNELINSLTISFNKLANRIDEGFNIEVRVEPIPEPDEESGEALNKVDQKKLKVVNSILEKQKRISFIETKGESILQLKEKN